MFEDMKAITIYVKFRIGDVVYLKTASEKCKGMVTGLVTSPLGTAYDVTWEGGYDSRHFDIELTTEFIPDFDSDTVDD